jgi:KUP system potassium uptake protein
MRENVDHNHTLHESAIIVSVETARVPYVSDDERLTISHLAYRDDGISLVTARYGFHEQPDVPALVRRAAATGLEGAVDLSDVTYFLSKIDIVQSDAPGMSPWRKRLFLATAHIAADAVDYFALPRRDTVLLGSAIEI